MNNHYEYDTSGVSSSLLAVVLLLPVIAISYFRGFGRGSAAAFSCSCVRCLRKKKEKALNVPRIVFFVSTALVLVPLRNVLYNQYGRGEGMNPYETLSVGEKSSKEEIETAYRKKVREVKIRVKDREKMKMMLQDVINAHEMLMDDKKRENWDAFGNSEKKESHVIAIPKWAMSARMSGLLILCYILALGVGVPQIVSAIWKVSFEHSAVGVSYKTTESLFHTMRENETCADVHRLAEWIALCSAEMREHAVRTPRENFDRVADLLEKNFAIAVNGNSAEDRTEKEKALRILCLSTLCMRDEQVLALIHEEDLAKAQKEVLGGVKAARVISFTLKQKETYFLTFELERSVVQSVPSPKCGEAQYTDVKFEDVFARAFENRKYEEKRTETDQIIDKQMFKTKITAVDMYTPCDGPISREEYVSGESEVSIRIVLTREGAQTSYTPVDSRRRPKLENLDVGDLSVIDLEEVPEINPKELEKHKIFIRHSTSEPVHAPLFKEQQEYSWVAVLEINGEPMAESPEFTPGSRDTEVFFKIPPLSSFISGTKKAVIDIHLICEKFFGRDTRTRKTLIIR